MAFKQPNEDAVQTSRKWTWLRVYYFETCKDDLILDALWPAVQKIFAQDEKPQAYFERDWKGGPNILIGLNGTLEQRTSRLRDGVQLIREYLAANPSHTGLSRAEFQQVAKTLGVWEARQAEAEMPLRFNNHVLVDCAEPYSPLLSDERLKSAVRQFLCQSSSIVLRWLALVRSGSWRRQHVALHAMVALAWLADPQRLRSHLSYCSHARGFLRTADAEGRLARSFSDRYAGRDGEAMRDFLKVSTDALCNGTSPLPGMNEYLTLLSKTLSDLHDGLQDGRYHHKPVLQMETLDPLGRAAIRALKLDETYRRLMELMDRSPVSRAWQITLSLVYLMLNQLGLKSLERYFACYLISRAAEDVYGEPVGPIVEELSHSNDPSEIFTFFACREKSGVNTGFDGGKE